MSHIKLIVAFILLVLAVRAQDSLALRDGSVLLVKVITVKDNEIRFKKFDNLSGPDFSYAVTSIKYIRYENGTISFFDTAPDVPVSKLGFNKIYPYRDGTFRIDDSNGHYSKDTVLSMLYIVASAKKDVLIGKLIRKSMLKESRSRAFSITGNILMGTGAFFLFMGFVLSSVPGNSGPGTGGGTVLIFGASVFGSGAVFRICGAISAKSSRNKFNDAVHRYNSFL